MATVWSRALLGTTTWLEPGGDLVVSCLSSAALHGGTTRVRLLLCLGITTVRTPGALRAVDTGSAGVGGFVEELPQALTPKPAMPTRPIANAPLLVTLLPFRTSALPACSGTSPGPTSRKRLDKQHHCHDHAEHHHHGPQNRVRQPPGQAHARVPAHQAGHRHDRRRPPLHGAEEREVHGRHRADQE